jgi:hypothetical protein
MTTPYQMCINNVASGITRRYLEDSADHVLEKPSNKDDIVVTAFHAAVVLGLAFCKDSGEVLSDIIYASLLNSKNSDSDNDMVRNQELAILKALKEKYEP